MSLFKTMAAFSALWTSADLIEQKFISKKTEIDKMKTLRMVTVGTFLIAPCIFKWLRVLEKKFPGKDASVIMKKVVCDQLFFAPPMITLFLTATNVMEGKGDFVNEWKTMFPQIYKRGVCYWPVVHAVNFAFVPPHIRPLTTAPASFVWSMFLCFIKEDKHKDECTENEGQSQESQ